MSRPKLTIVVTCTDRKLVVPASHLMARNLASASVNDRADEWIDRLRTARATIRLLDLYKGESWSQAKRLATAARNAGFEPQLFVASAGLGLRSVDELAPAYAATFARGHLDSVVGNVSDAQAWWNRLPDSRMEAQGGQAIWVLSEAYAQAMQTGIATLDQETTLVFGGANSTPEALRIRSNRNLRSALGGTITSLNTRMAIRWLEIAEQGDLMGANTRREWARWAESASRPENYGRRPLADGAIRLLIQEMRGTDAGLSKTAALKALRDSGIACEQRRFSGLFEEVCRA